MHTLRHGILEAVVPVGGGDDLLVSHEVTALSGCGNRSWTRGKDTCTAALLLKSKARRDAHHYRHAYAMDAAGIVLGRAASNG